MGCNIKPPVACSPSLPPRDCGSRDPPTAPPPRRSAPPGRLRPCGRLPVLGVAARGDSRGDSRWPRPLRRLWCASRRTTGPFAERWCVVGTFPLKPNSAHSHSNTSWAQRQSALSGTGASPAARGCSASTSGRLRSRAAVAASVRGRRGQIGSILRDLPRCIRGDRGPAGRRQLLGGTPSAAAARRQTRRDRNPSRAEASRRRVAEDRCGRRRRRGATECSSPRASSRATGARRRRTRRGSTPTRRCRRRGRRRGALPTSTTLRNRHQRNPKKSASARGVADGAAGSPAVYVWAPPFY